MLAIISNLHTKPIIIFGRPALVITEIDVIVMRTGHSALYPEAVAEMSFLVGRDVEGHWLAVERHGLGGGIFRDRDCALRYANDECNRRPGAVMIVEEPIAWSTR